MATTKNTSSPAPIMKVLTWDELAARFQEEAPDIKPVTVVDTLRGTWKKTEGAVILGIISHLYTFNENQDGELLTLTGVALEIKAPCQVKVNGKVEMAVPGDKVGVTLSKKLRAILHLRTGDLVGIMAEREVELEGGRRVWEFKVRASAPLQKEPMAVPDLPF